MLHTIINTNARTRELTLINDRQQKQSDNQNRKAEKLQRVSCGKYREKPT